MSKIKTSKSFSTMLALSIFAGDSYGRKEFVKIDYEPCKYKGMTNKELGTKRKPKRRKR